MSLRLQINLGIFLSFLIILGLGGAAAVWQARNSVSEEVESTVALAYRLIATGLTQPTLSAFNQNQWLSQIGALHQTRHFTIEIEDDAGRIVRLSDQAATIGESMPPDWFVRALSDEYPSAEYRIQTHDGRPHKIVIHPNPLDEIRESWEETRALFASVAFMGLILLIAVHLIFRRALDSVSEILKGLQSIENGDYQKKLPDFRIAEFAKIAHAVNHLTEALSSAKKENADLAAHSLEIQEEERQKLARELHDELGQSVTAIKAMAVSAKRNKSDAENINDAIVSICDHLFTVIRSMMRNLHPVILSDLGLKATLEDLIEHWTDKSPGVRFSIRCDRRVDALDRKKSIQIFRVIQECLTNIARHSGAEKAQISLEIEPEDVLRIRVSDDGKGCDMNSLNLGYGLRGIRERIENLRGGVRFVSATGRGMTVQAEIPVPVLTAEHAK
ncbi:MAG: ATP-binding protein [Gammaproteobacteria bacterium]